MEGPGDVFPGRRKIILIPGEWKLAGDYFQEELTKVTRRFLA